MGPEPSEFPLGLSHVRWRNSVVKVAYRQVYGGQSGVESKHCVAQPLSSAISGIFRPLAAHFPADNNKIRRRHEILSKRKDAKREKDLTRFTS